MKKLLSRRRGRKPPLPTRITNETVAEHREKILAGGRRFKYPMQYARHRLVIMTTALVVGVFVLLGVVGWWQLYIAQSTNTLLYRVIQIVPVPVASIDGQSVRYSDYLMYYNSSIHFLQKSGQLDLKSESDLESQRTYQKRQNLDIAIRNAFAAKLAKQLDIEVTPDELESTNKDRLKMANGEISQETYNASTMSLLGWTPEEEQRSTVSQLLKNKVAYAIDEEAKKRVDIAARLLNDSNADFEKVALELGGGAKASVTEMVPLVNNDGGLTDMASKLSQGQVSSVFRSTTGDGYYFVKLLEKTETELRYAAIQIPLTEFNKRLEKLRQDGEIREYIKISVTKDNK